MRWTCSPHRGCTPRSPGPSTTPARQVIVDLSGVVLLASAGLVALQDAQMGCEARQGEPLRVVVDHSRPVIRPLQMAGLDQQVRLFYDLHDALHDYDAPSATSSDLDGLHG